MCYLFVNIFLNVFIAPDKTVEYQGPELQDSVSRTHVRVLKHKLSKGEIHMCKYTKHRNLFKVS